MKCGTIKGGAFVPPIFMGRKYLLMKFNKIQFVYIDVDYLKYLHDIDSEFFFDEKKNYDVKPHLGILLNNNKREYVIPLTSAKEKHKNWADVSADWYRIYEIIDTTITPVDENDIVVEIKNQEIIKTLDKDNLENFKQRIISVLDMRKMFPVDKKLYKEVKFVVYGNVPKADQQKHFLMLKEYNFLSNIKEDIEKKTTKIYDKQIEKKKVLKYHCNYKKLEEALDKYLEEKCK